MFDVPPGRLRFGKFLVIFVFTVIFAAIAALPLTVAQTKGADFFEVGPGRRLLAGIVFGTVSFGVLAYCTWIGQSWARWFTGFLLFVAGVFAIPIVKEYKIGLPAGMVITLGLIGLGALLTLTGSVGDFIRTQAHRRRFGGGDESEAEEAEEG